MMEFMDAGTLDDSVSSLSLKIAEDYFGKAQQSQNVEKIISDLETTLLHNPDHEKASEQLLQIVTNYVIKDSEERLNEIRSTDQARDNVLLLQMLCAPNMHNNFTPMDDNSRNKSQLILLNYWADIMESSMLDELRNELKSYLLHEYGICKNNKELRLAFYLSGLYSARKGEIPQYYEGFMLSNIGLCYNSIGNNEAARKCYSKALDHLNGFDSYKQNIFDIKILLANACMNMGRVREAEDICKECLQESGEGWEKAATLRTLGLVHSNKMQFPEALAQFEAAIAEFAKIKDHEGQSVVYSNMAECYLALNEYEKVKENLIKAIHISPGMKEDNYYRLGQACFVLKQHEKAKQWYEKGIAAARNDGNYITLSRMAGYIAALNQFSSDEALMYFNKVVANNEQTSLDENKSNFWSGFGQHLAFEGRCIDEAIDAYERAEHAELQKWDKLSDHESMVFHEEMGRGIFHPLIVLYVQTGKTDKALETAERWRSRAMIQHIKSQAPNIIDCNISKILQFATATNSYLVYYILILRAMDNKFAPRIFCWIIPPNKSPIIFRETLFNFEEAQKVIGESFDLTPGSIKREWERAMKIVQFGAKNKDDDNKYVKFLYNQLWQPFAEVIPIESQVIIFPHEMLFTVQFALLLNPSGDRLIDHYTITIGPSISTLIALQSIHVQSTDLHAVIIGNPTIPADPKFTNLTFAEKECLAVADVTKLRASHTLLIGAAATKVRVLSAISGLNKHGSFIHIATHGDMTTSSAAFMPGVLILAQPADPADKDYFLTGDEIQKIDLKHVNLVFLNCCNTGMGDLKSTGLYGLGYAFLFAGARSVILTQWAVLDNVHTMHFAEVFYDKFMNGSSAASALRSAMVALKKDGVTQHIWGAYLLFGCP